MVIKPEECETLSDLQGLIEYARTYARILTVDAIQAGREANNKANIEVAKDGVVTATMVDERGKAHSWDAPGSMPNADDLARASKAFDEYTTKKEAADGEQSS